MVHPGVSVITVVRNLVKAGRREMFDACLLSVHKQELRGKEHIVIDGASSDGTVDLLEAYARKGWIRYLSEPDKGIYDAMNKGLALAEGTYTAFLNSDDFYHDPLWLSRSMQALDASGAACSSAPVRSLSRDGNVKLDGIPSWGNMFMKMGVNHQSLLMRTETIRSLGGFSLEFPCQADYDLLLRFLLNGGRYVTLRREGCTFRNFGMASQQPWQATIRERLGILWKNYSRWNASWADCVDIEDFGHVPGWLFRELISCLHPVHRAEFEAWHRKTARRKIRRELWTCSFRQGEEVLRLLGICLWDRRFPRN